MSKPTNVAASAISFAAQNWDAIEEAVARGDPKCFARFWETALKFESGGGPQDQTI